jgi:L-asparaginase/Glu-tRNA(Gln) amidotransferase subunit D
MKKNNILLLITGGTFCSVQQDRKLSINYKNQFEQIDKCSSNILKIIKKNFNFTSNFNFFVKSPFFILSENITPKHWKILINTILEETQKNKIDGVLVIHCTDTMTYTANAIAYIEEISKKYPVVFTGANFPIYYENTDAEINFINSLKTLDNFIKNNIKGVFLVFNGANEKCDTYVHLATKVKKIKYVGNETYKSFNQRKDFMGKITTYNIFDFRKKEYLDIFPQEQKFKNLKIDFNDKNMIALKIYPGLDPNVLMTLFNNEKKYFILEIYNSGTASANNDNYSLISAIEYIIKNGGIIFAISQQENINGITLDIYETSEKLKKAGVVSLKNMIWDSAIVKLMLAISNFEKKEQIIKFMQENIAGEIF